MKFIIKSVQYISSISYLLLTNKLTLSRYTLFRRLATSKLFISLLSLLPVDFEESIKYSIVMSNLYAENKRGLFPSLLNGAEFNVKSRKIIRMPTDDILLKIVREARKDGVN